MTARDLLLARRAKRAGANSSLRIIIEARRAGLPISLAFALVDGESGFRNVFGHDLGAIMKGELVTPARIARLLSHIAKGGVSNGVGYTQLTWPGYIRQANAMPGGASVIKNQLRVGFAVLAGHVHHYGVRRGLAVYNAGDPNSGQGKRYATIMLAKRDKWHRVLVPKKVRESEPEYIERAQKRLGEDVMA
jgi:hypothetical protein